MSLKMRKQFPIAAVAAVLMVGIFGCSPKFIVYSDGYPAPEEVNVVWSQDGAISMKWFFSRWYLKTIESGSFSEEIEYPQHLSFESLNVLSSDTKYVVVSLQVHNPRMKKYRLVKWSRIGDRQMEEPICEWTIREIHHATVLGPLVPGTESGVSVKIILGGDEGSSGQILSTGELNYLIEPSDRTSPTVNQRR